MSQFYIIIQIRDKFVLIAFIFPNPASDFIQIKNIELQKIAMEIYSMKGQLVRSYGICSSVEQVSISNLPAGLYVVKLSAECDSKNMFLLKK